METLVEDLGLSTLISEKVSKLTHSEKQRLNVACQLYSEASILILDQMTLNLDIFDTFFLVEYLKQWCSSNRIVVMTLQPPTFEIFSMCSSILVLSKGHVIYTGHRYYLTAYMNSIGYPCPPYKNPADYYRKLLTKLFFVAQRLVFFSLFTVDLVTLDDLSSAALVESSFRIETLAKTWNQFSSGYNTTIAKASLPFPANNSNIFRQFSALLKR